MKQQTGKNDIVYSHVMFGQESNNCPNDSPAKFYVDKFNLSAQDAIQYLLAI